MAIVIEMPKLSDTMQEGVIAKWNVKVGDNLKSGDIIAEVETDKATMDVEVYDAGTVLKLLAEEGEAVALGAKMAIIGKPGEDISALINGGSAPEAAKPTEVKEEASKPEQEAFSDPILGNLANGASSSEDGRIKASPLARKIAQDKGVDLSSLKGSGPEGRIVKSDVESASTPIATPVAINAPAASAPVVVPSGTAFTDTKISQMRKTIAKRLAESKFTNPHFYETIDIDMKSAIKAREELNKISDVKISFNDFVVKASAVALKKHPKVNSSWLGDVIRTHHTVSVAVAVAIEDGLVTPVIRNTDTKGLNQISKETKDLAGRARDRKLAPEEWEGSTFTISNLGMFGIEEFTAIINPPNACILAVGAIRNVPVVENGAVVPGKRMKVTLSSDHRVVDGASSAEFLQTLKGLLENPMGMLL